MEDALYEITSMRLFAGLSLEGAIRDHTVSIPTLSMYLAMFVDEAS